MRYGLHLPNFDFAEPTAIFPGLAAMAEAAEDSGFASLWVMDHFHQMEILGGRNGSMLEGFALLAAIAARTSSIELGLLVAGVTYRNPAHVAKLVTTIDVISGGRAVCGLGAGWYEDEHVAYGFPFPPMGERFARLEEAVAICRSMFQQEETTFAGTHYSTDRAANRPQPMRAGGIPILIGGSGPKRTLRLVAQYADACNVSGSASRCRELLEILDGHCDSVGRAPGDVHRTRLGSLFVCETTARAEELRDLLVGGSRTSDAAGTFTIGTPDAIREEIQAFEDAGLDELIFNLPMARSGEDVVAAAGALGLKPA